MIKDHTLNVEVISDVMCPWCFIGKRNLEAAIKKINQVQVLVKWLPFQLDRTLPKTGMDRQEYFANKFGTQERYQQVYGPIIETSKSIGLNLNLDSIKVSPNTMDAHRLILWAGGQSNKLQNKMVERLFQLYFQEGANIGSDDVLIEAAKNVGMDASIVEKLLKTDQDKEWVKDKVSKAGQLGIQAVPSFLIDNSFAVSGAQPTTTLFETLKYVLNQREDSTST